LVKSVVKRAKDSLVFGGILGTVVMCGPAFLTASYGYNRLEEWWSQLPALRSYFAPPAGTDRSPGPRPSSRELPVVEIDSVASDAVILIRSQRGQGSAVVVAPDLLLSACHVGQEQVMAFPVESDPVRLRLEKSVRNSDRCLFRADRRMPHVVPGVRPAATLQSRERVYAYGFPSEMPTLSSGVFLDVYVEEDGTRLLRTTARVAPGNSGGALFDRFGNLVGVIQAVSKDRTVSFALIADDWLER
jgi:S1-C subfamily serine protease